MAKNINFGAKIKSCPKNMKSLRKTEIYRGMKFPTLPDAIFGFLTCVYKSNRI